MRSRLIIALVVLGALAASGFFVWKNNSARMGAAIAPFIFNQQVIEGVYGESLDLKNPDSVLERLFSYLPSSVTVYPTENYYYFQLYANGKTIWGNLRFDVHDRDQGKLHLGYFEYDENGKVQDYAGKTKMYGKEDGVTVTRRDAWHYAVKAFGKTVLFTLNNVGYAPPKYARLAPSEEYVGTIFDESGLKFFLLYNGEAHHLFYVLSEDSFVPEQFLPLDESISKDVVLGRRTGMAFFNDNDHNRKILIAVNAHNAMRNNYYDGPFDQLPDNYVEQTHIADYLLKAYPALKGEIDQYGVFTKQEGARMAVTPYYTYTLEKDLSFVDSCKTSTPSSAKFLACITPDFSQ
jgi:hypothetical protein